MCEGREVREGVGVSSLVAVRHQRADPPCDHTPNSHLHHSHPLAESSHMAEVSSRAYGCSVAARHTHTDSAAQQPLFIVAVSWGRSLATAKLNPQLRVSSWGTQDVSQAGLSLPCSWTCCQCSVL